MDQLFQSVVNSNLQTFVNGVKQESEIYSLQLKKTGMSEDQVRELAAKFFFAQLSNRINEKLNRDL